MRYSYCQGFVATARAIYAAFERKTSEAVTGAMTGLDVALAMACHHTKQDDCAICASAVGSIGRMIQLVQGLKADFVCSEDCTSAGSEEAECPLVRRQEAVWQAFLLLADVLVALAFVHADADVEITERDIGSIVTNATSHFLDAEINSPGCAAN